MLIGVVAEHAVRLDVLEVSQHIFNGAISEQLGGLSDHRKDFTRDIEVGHQELDSNATGLARRLSSLETQPRPPHHARAT